MSSEVKHAHLKHVVAALTPGRKLTLEDTCIFNNPSAVVATAIESAVFLCPRITLPIVPSKK
jgi:hypothetical protein